MIPRPHLAFLTTGFLFGAASAATLVENFEGSTAGTGTPPTGWSLVTVAGTPTYATTGAGLGSNGSGGSSGLAGQVSSSAFTTGQVDLPGAYLVADTVFDATLSFSGTFDFNVISEGDFDDGVFVLGDIGTGITTNTSGELLSMKFYDPASGSNPNRLVDGNNNVLDGIAADIVDNDVWYRASFTWTPTSGTTGDFSLTVSDFSSDLGTVSATGFTFDSATTQFGFGSVNDTMRFDNISITQVPEPSTMLLALGGLGGLFIRRRR